MEKSRKRVFVGLSGGVDSSVAAALLKEQKYNVIGIHLRCYNVDGCAEQEAEDARRAAETIGIPFYVLDFEEEYKRRVVRYMVEGYRRGITPNPDVMCNKEIKFGLFLEQALAMGADYVATGHYVRLCRQFPISNFQFLNKSKIPNPKPYTQNPSGYTLVAARDKNKDQSYFLWTLTQAQLKHCLFPIGDYLKSEVRALAKKFDLPNAEKKDSQGICFLGQVTLEDFLKDYIPEKRGAVKTLAGEKIGEHRGAAYYTIGQRHGLRLGTRDKKQGTKDDFEPYYIASKDTVTNTVVVAEGGDNQALYRDGINITNINLIYPIQIQSSRNQGRDGRSSKKSKNQLAVFARIRYRQPVFKAMLLLTNSRELVSKGELIFEKPQKFVAAGQSAVFYNARGVMLGGGIIA
jgi:tRNA-uridine 2-sulfurtransferase